MDTIKIGCFIANERKKKNLTQEDLATKLNITSKAVSKWERGKGLPDASIMIPLCNELDISVNELLIGEHIKYEDYKIKSEENLFQIANKEQYYNKMLLVCEDIIGIMSAVFTVVLVSIVSFINLSTTIRVLLIVLAFISLIIGVSFAIKFETEAGYCECKFCKNRFIPKYTAVFFSPHFGRTRYLKCPKCHKYGWCKKVIK